MAQQRLTVEQIQWLQNLSKSIDSPEKLYKLQKLIENEKILLDLVDDAPVLIEMAKKEVSWAWLKKASRDTASLFLGISAALYAAYEAWLYLLGKITKNLTTGD